MFGTIEDHLHRDPGDLHIEVLTNEGNTVTVDGNIAFGHILKQASCLTLPSNETSPHSVEGIMAFSNEFTDIYDLEIVVVVEQHEGMIRRESPGNSFDNIPELYSHERILGVPEVYHDISDLGVYSDLGPGSAFQLCPGGAVMADQYRNAVLWDFVIIRFNTSDSAGMFYFNK